MCIMLKKKLHFSQFLACLSVCLNLNTEKFQIVDFYFLFNKHRREWKGRIYFLSFIMFPYSCPFHNSSLSADPFTPVKFKEIELLLFHFRQFYENDLAFCTRLFSMVTMALLSNKFLNDNLTPMKFQLLNFHYKQSTKRNFRSSNNSKRYFSTCF